MSVEERMALAEVKNRLSEVVDMVEREQARVTITRHGKPAAVVVSVDDLEALEETLEVLSDPMLMAEIREAQAELAAGLGERLTEAEVRERLEHRRR